jgi:hypothetical protein
MPFFQHHPLASISAAVPRGTLSPIVKVALSAARKSA